MSNDQELYQQTKKIASTPDFESPWSHLNDNKSRKPASLEAWLEVFLLERPKGVVWAPIGNAFFSLFRVHFLEPLNPQK